MMQRLFVGLAGLWLALPACAEAPADALQWLGRVAEAARRLNYSGVFVYQRGNQTETSRITHFVDAGKEMERLEVLDGSPREVVRVNDEVRCYLPENQLVIVERRNSRRQAFPALLPASLVGLTEHYTIRKGAVERVAGLESQSILIEPKDDLRYGHQFWVDGRSGLLLKAGLIGSGGKPVESFAFTELRIGGPLEAAAVAPGREAESKDWKVLEVRSTAQSGDGPWLFRNMLPGFRKVMSLRRQARADMPEMTHTLFSDGLATVSVFVEPLGADKSETGAFAMGSVNGFRRIVDNHLVVVMGDVPPNSLQRLADGMEMKRK